MSFFGGLLGSVGNFLGATSSRDNGRAQGLTDTYGNNLTNLTNSYNANTDSAFNTYRNAANANGNYSNMLGSTNYMGGAQDAYQNQVANYNQQQNASQLLYNQATGQAASAADLQMQAGLGNANNQVQSAAYSQQGGISPGLTQRNMLGAQAIQNANIVGQGAALRAQEQAQAQQAYASQLNNMGLTADRMTAAQQSLGDFAYRQGQANLNYQSANNQNIYGAQSNMYNAQQNVGATNLTNGYNSQMSNLDANWKANQQQAQALGHTLSAAATGGASWLKDQRAKDAES